MPSQACPLGNHLMLVAICKEVRSVLFCSDHKQPSKAACRGGICGSSNVSLPARRRRGVFAGENPITDTCQGTAGSARMENQSNCCAHQRRGSLFWQNGLLHMGFARSELLSRDCDFSLRSGACPCLSSPLLGTVGGLFARCVLQLSRSPVP